MTAILSDIKNFEHYFCDSIFEIGKLDNKPFYKKLLFSCLLDALGKSRFPQSGNERIRSLISNHSNWMDKDRVSLVQLNLFFNKSKHQCSLTRFIQSALSKMAHGQIYRSEIDIFKCDLLSKACGKNEILLIDRFTYSSLFCEYRHHLVHEFREPGHGMHISDDEATPYYHGCLNPEENSSDWQLVFPLGIFKLISESAIESLKQYFITKEINPYDSYDFDDLWISSLSGATKK